MRYGPALISQRAFGLCTTLTWALPFSIATSAPWPSTLPRRPRVSLPSLMTVPSSKRSAGWPGASPWRGTMAPAASIAPASTCRASGGGPASIRRSTRGASATAAIAIAAVAPPIAIILRRRSALRRWAWPRTASRPRACCPSDMWPSVLRASRANSAALGLRFSSLTPASS
jgi:hypothetical protein